MSVSLEQGIFCPNNDCPDFTATYRRNIIRFGRTKSGRQRFQCKTCQKTFSERTGTLFYRRRTPSKEILETLALLAEGVRVSSLSRAKGFKEDTILDWLREAERNKEVIETVLSQDYHINRARIHELWEYFN